MSVSVTTHYKMEIKHAGGAAVVTGVPKPFDVNDGDTLEITSLDGTFRVEVNPWPFAEPMPNNEVTTPAPLTFKNDGPDFLMFTGDCYITPTGSNVEYGYAPGSGTNGSVKPPGRG